MMRPLSEKDSMIWSGVFGMHLECWPSGKVNFHDSTAMDGYTKWVHDLVSEHVVICLVDNTNYNFLIIALLLQLSRAIQIAETVDKPPVADIFQDVYDAVPSNLREQERFLRETIKRHTGDYPPNVPV